MRILGIETTGPFCSAALLAGGEIKEERTNERMVHLSMLVPMIKQLLAAQNLGIKDLDYIAVSTGPGSFTGIRIGVSTGRALSQASGVPLIGVPTLLSFGCAGCEENVGGVAAPVIDARRDQVYGAAYRGSEEIVSAGPYMLDEFVDLVSSWVPGAEKIKFIGDGTTSYGEQIKELCAGKNYEMEERFPSATDVVKMAQRMITDEEDRFRPLIGLDENTLEPDYMRIPEAERKLKAGLIGSGMGSKTKNAPAKADAKGGMHDETGKASAWNETESGTHDETGKASPNRGMGGGR